MNNSLLSRNNNGLDGKPTSLNISIENLNNKIDSE